MRGVKTEGTPPLVHIVSVSAGLLPDRGRGRGPWGGAAMLGGGGLELVGQAVTRVARGEKATPARQDCLVILEVYHKFRTEMKQRQRR